MMSGITWKITFLWITGILTYGNPTIITSTASPSGEYNIWVDGTIHFGDAPSGIACDVHGHLSKPLVEIEQVSEGRWRIKISCKAYTS